MGSNNFNIFSDKKTLVRFSKVDKMKESKLRVFICIFILVSFYSCTTVSVTKHPDFNYFPTNPKSVIIYDRLTPTYPFIIIGRINIDATWTLSSKEMNKKVKEKAAAIGGDGVVITDVNVDIVAFNSEVTTEGTITDRGNSLDYYAVSRDTSTYIPVTTMYGYVVKRQFSERAQVPERAQEKRVGTKEDSFRYQKVTVRVAIIKNSIDLTVLVGSSTSLVLTCIDASSIAWLKEGMDVVMLYYTDDNILLFKPDGENYSRFKRIK